MGDLGSVADGDGVAHTLENGAVELTGSVGSIQQDQALLLECHGRLLPVNSTIRSGAVAR
jgi:hypothetical protein